MRIDELHEAFVRACVNHDDAQVVIVIADGLDINRKDREGRAPLHYAASSRNLTAAQSLITAGADIDIEDRNGNTPLCDAVFYSEGDREMVALLLDAGANPNHANAHGVSPASLAGSISNFDFRDLFSK